MRKMKHIAFGYSRRVPVFCIYANIWLQFLLGLVAHSSFSFSLKLLLKKINLIISSSAGVELPGWLLQLISINCVPKLVWDFPRLCGLDTLIKFIYLLDDLAPAMIPFLFVGICFLF